MYYLVLAEWRQAQHLASVLQLRIVHETLLMLLAMKDTEHFPHRSQEEVDRGRTASYLTTPAQIPACGFPAPGSS